jgi:hypothetical protein
MDTYEGSIRGLYEVLGSSAYEYFKARREAKVDAATD